MYRHIEKDEKKLTGEELNDLIERIEYESFAQNSPELSQAAYTLKYQKKEIERLTSLYDGQTAFMTSSIGDLPLTVEGLRKAVDEISRLLTVQTELQELNAKYYNEAKDLRRENAELQNQVDELKFDKEILKKLIDKREKDTAKEIFTDLLKEFSIRKSCGNADIVVKEVAQRYGVEVE